MAKKEVRDWPRGNNGGALADGFVVKREVTHLWRHGLNAFVEHFDITAQRNKGDNKFRTLLIKTAPQRFAKAD
ncbi:Uncharacterised protein [Klebsiella michiganensis]|uniref:Uncharacterized protein n=1 Tax=Klebsiella michiganensis TaxID=1134687 RepID=A0A7H4N758_9ENTR|nr:Uncharacterised protein [Klebsiella michiganensis]